MATESRERVFLTGATGYIGGRLAPRLLEEGYIVRCFSRSASKLTARPWADHPHVEVVEGDAGDEQALEAVLRGCQHAYYLVHSMDPTSGDYRERDLQLATKFARACSEAGVARILYLGGLGETGEGLSKHLTSRREVEAALASTQVPLTVFRAAMIIGSGSASFEILRYLVERLPIMVTPRWVSTDSQPIAVGDVLFYLVRALRTPATVGRTLDIGGPEIRSYAHIMQEMASALGLRSRFVIPVLVLTPHLSSLWIHLVTPLHASIARPLAEGLKNRVVCRNDDVLRLMPHECMTIREAMEASLAQYQSGGVETSWSDAGVIPGDPSWAGGTVFTESHEATAVVPLETVWRSVTSLGGARGYYGADLLWRIRGGMDRLVGGPGLRRGRRDPNDLRLGDSLDFWRVTKLDSPRYLELTAEMRLPGVATLDFELEKVQSSPPATRLRTTARFRPRGLFGIAYWYLVLPLHGIVFTKMLHGMLRDAVQADEKTLAKTD